MKTARASTRHCERLRPSDAADTAWLLILVSWSSAADSRAVPALSASQAEAWK